MMAPRLSYSPDGDGSLPPSPIYRPTSDLWAGPSRGAQPVLEITFGPGVQLDDISERVTRMDIDGGGREADGPGVGGYDPAVQCTMNRSGTPVAAQAEGLGVEAVTTNDEYAAFHAGMFTAVSEPVLSRPDLPPPSSSRRRRILAALVRSSPRLAARPSTVPVAERAQQKLMRELAFVGSKSAAPDAAVTAYVDLVGHELPEQAVQAIRAATRLGNSELTRVLEVIAAESGPMGMEDA